MERFERKDLEQQQVERALHQIGRSAHGVTPISVTETSVDHLLSVIKGSL
jgi:hypothetical protein